LPSWRAIGRGREELHITPVLKKQLKVLGVQPELIKGFADLVRHARVRGCFCPPIFPARMFELQGATVSKKQNRPIEGGIHHVLCDLVTGRFSQHATQE
jgi:hypothetical protein